MCFVEDISKRKLDTSEQYLKWKFSKQKGKKGLYFEYKSIPTENSLVMYQKYNVIYLGVHRTFGHF